MFVEHTYLSDEDLLKLQTFPAYWFVAGTRMERAFQIGNAVPPVLSRAVAKALGKGGSENFGKDKETFVAAAD